MRSKTVDIDGPVHYAEWGQGGRTVILVHGLGGSYVEWLPIAPVLAKRFRVVAPDMIGFGHTPVKRRHSDLDSNQELLDRFLAEVVGAPAVLVGHSMGGLIAMLQAGRHPDSVSELVLIDPAMPPGGQEATPAIPKPLLDLVQNHVRLGNLAGLVAAALLSPRRLVEDALRRAVVDFDSLDPGLVDALVAMEKERIRAGQPYVGYTEARMSLAKAYLDIRRFDRSAVAPITAPTLLIYGASDPIIQRSAIDRVARRQPGWRVEIIENAGHDPNMEVPGRTVELILAHLEVAAAP